MPARVCYIQSVVAGGGVRFAVSGLTGTCTPGAPGVEEWEILWRPSRPFTPKVGDKLTPIDPEDRVTRTVTAVDYDPDVDGYTLTVEFPT